MPSRLPLSSRGHLSEGNTQEMDTGIETTNKSSRRASFLQSIGGIWKRNHDQPDQTSAPSHCLPVEPSSHVVTDFQSLKRRSSHPENLQTMRKNIHSLPRTQTLQRQQSERRDRLLEVPCTPHEKRAMSAERRRGNSASGLDNRGPPCPIPLPSSSAPDIVTSGCDTVPDGLEPSDMEHDGEEPSRDNDGGGNGPEENEDDAIFVEDRDDHEDNNEENDEDDEDDEVYHKELREEFEQRWILNLSMHFRDLSNPEKFFVTYAQKPNEWRRLTVSIDYRDAPPDSLEAALSDLPYQRDKSFRVFSAIRESLPDIQFYPSVTNLKLQTTAEDGQLHIHVREDANEKFDYPAAKLMSHVNCPRYPESALSFDSHISGFVYKVRVGDETFIKKEIPGPDTVDEFLYEVNALEALSDSPSVVSLQGLVTDDTGSVVKGLLISYASQGALVDILYDFEGQLPFSRREKWAKQIVQGLADIHEAGFVQGDFTLSNIVIDDSDDAQIIDINRRGCPVGWEPPELGKLIDSGQRISMHIGVKTDVYQLGMVLWALAEESDEPERSLPLSELKSSVPDYYRSVVSTCLSERPQQRLSAKAVLCRFPASIGRSRGNSGRPLVDFQLPPPSQRESPSGPATTSHRSDKEYIDPALAVTIDEVHGRQRVRVNQESSARPNEQLTFADPTESRPESTNYHFESSGSWIVGRSRGRSPGLSSRRRAGSPYGGATTSATSLSRSPAPVDTEKAVSSDDETDFAYPQEIDSRYFEATQASTSSAPVTAQVYAHLALQYGPPNHQDSGFDEQMLEDMRLEDTLLPCSDLFSGDPRINVDMPIVSESKADVSDLKPESSRMEGVSSTTDQTDTPIEAREGNEFTAEQVT